MTDKNLDIWLTIPSGDRRQYLPDIIKESQIPLNKIVIVHTVESEPIEGVNNIAVLNDDLILKNNPINKIADRMSSTKSVIGYPVPNIGIGYCWVLDVKSNIRADENYRWWYGDNDIQLQAEQIGNVTYVLADVEHVHPNELTANSPHLMELTRADEEYFKTKWLTTKQEYL
jgi:hypothetical protein